MRFRHVVLLSLALLLSGCSGSKDGGYGAAGSASSSPTSPTYAMPAITFRPDEDLDRLIVTTSSADADWDQLGLLVAACETNKAGLQPVVGSDGKPWVNEPGSLGSLGALTSPSNSTRCGNPTPVDLAGSKQTVVVNDYVEPAG